MQILKELSWESLILKRGAELEDCYTKILRELGKTSGILGQIFTKSQNKIQDPAKLYTGYLNAKIIYEKYLSQNLK
jgi:type I restriction enzyme M protein